MPDKADAPLLFDTAADWAQWLAQHHTTTAGVWLKIAKAGAQATSATYAQALEVALCYGWIDGQKKADSDTHWLQRFTPRGARSIWSKINRDKALKLIDAGLMQAAGLREVERAQADGRWDAAYDSAKTADVPDDLQAALDASPQAKAFFATLNKQNRYAILFRVQTAKKAETRARRIAQFVDMLTRHDKLYP